MRLIRGAQSIICKICTARGFINAHTDPCLKIAYRVEGKALLLPFVRLESSRWVAVHVNNEKEPR